MNLTIKTNKNYNGEVKEYVPATFEITPQEGLIITTNGDTKTLTWNKKLTKGKTYNLQYEFDAPDISPYLFTLGSLEIGAFSEVRQWMIASDAIAKTLYIRSDSDGGTDAAGTATVSFTALTNTSYATLITPGSDDDVAFSNAFL